MKTAMSSSQIFRVFELCINDDESYRGGQVKTFGTQCTWRWFDPLLESYREFLLNNTIATKNQFNPHVVDLSLLKYRLLDFEIGKKQGESGRHKSCVAIWIFTETTNCFQLRK